MRRDRGFTLAEALIAVSILALIGTLTYGTFARAMEARERAGKITSHYHEIRQAMLRMSHEISTAFLSYHQDPQDPRTATIFSGETHSGGMRLDFTSFSHMRTGIDVNESDQNELSYYLDGEKLMRREQARIDDEPDAGGVEQVLATGITSLRFEFYDPKQDRWQDDWDSTDSDHRGLLPMFVKIELKTKDLAGKEEVFVTKTRVFLKRSILIFGTGFAPAPPR